MSSEMPLSSSFTNFVKGGSIRPKSGKSRSRIHGNGEVSVPKPQSTLLEVSKPNGLTSHPPTGNDIAKNSQEVADTKSDHDPFGTDLESIGDTTTTWFDETSRAMAADADAMQLEPTIETGADARVQQQNVDHIKRNNQIPAVVSEEVEYEDDPDEFENLTEAKHNGQAFLAPEEKIEWENFSNMKSKNHDDPAAPRWSSSLHSARQMSLPRTYVSLPDIARQANLASLSCVDVDNGGNVNGSSISLFPRTSSRPPSRLSKDEHNALKNDRFPSINTVEQHEPKFHKVAPRVEAVQAEKVELVKTKIVEGPIKDNFKIPKTRKHEEHTRVSDSSTDEQAGMQRYFQHKSQSDPVNDHGSTRTLSFADTTYDPLKLLELSLNEGATPEQWRTFFGIMSFDTHWAAGDGLTNEIDRNGNGLQQLRQRKRMLTEQYEKSISNRFAKVQKRKARIDATMNSIKKRGARMVKSNKNKRSSRDSL